MSFYLGIGFIVLVDQLTKQWVLWSLDSPWWILPDEVGLELVFNPGIAFSLPITGAFAVLVPLLIIGYLLRMKRRDIRHGWLSDLVFSLVLGGALGNLVDRFLYEKVIDFLKFWSFPTFNLADSFVVVGLALLILFHKKLFKST